MTVKPDSLNLAERAHVENVRELIEFFRYSGDFPNVPLVHVKALLAVIDNHHPKPVPDDKR